MTRSAIRAAQHVNAPELLYQWQWQAGRILARTGAEDEALLAYRQAVNTVQSIRAELTPVYEGHTGAFRERMAPLYLELVDLVLRRATSARSADQLTPILKEARETLELFKVAELRDYFRDDCVDRVLSKSTGLETVSTSTAIIYPISLPDRVELLVSFGSELKQFTVPVRADVLSQTVVAFRDRLEKRTTREFLPYARRLNAWLIQPLERELAAAGIKTLIFVPDGALRTIPMGALHDGHDFLVSRFAIGITPSLYLTDPAPLRRDHPRVLAAGLTEGVQGFPPLMHVAAEIHGLQKMYGARALLDGEFGMARLERELRSEKFSIVHIASHGQFDSRADDTFVLAFDGKLTLEHLNRLVGMSKYREEPIELLTLSACDTAAGDDRAALGLAGIAVKAGARSALATLWNVNDAVSTELVLAFYRELGDASVSRAQALQRAQLESPQQSPV